MAKSKAKNLPIDVDKLLSGDRRSLSKAITLVESKKLEHRKLAQELIEEILPHTGNAKRIGITGTPGVGKSTFIESFGLYLIREHKHKVAVLTIDPSSPVSGGSILGDKTRMEELSQNMNSFIRPSPSSGTLGGVALKTRESMLLCEAAGYDTIIVETVGVGQSEYEVADMVDFFLLLVLPGGGDDIQGIKKGILELSDLILINKADGASKTIADQTLAHYLSALELFNHKKDEWVPRVLACSALENTGIDGAWKVINDFYKQSSQSGKINDKRATQNQKWMNKVLWQMIEQKLKENPEVLNSWESYKKAVGKGSKSPYLAALEIVNRIFK